MSSNLQRHGPLALKGVAIVLLILLGRKALVDVDLHNYDSLGYHLPFAARFWGITPAGKFLFQDRLEPIYQGFPLLGEILQGLLWMFFDHIQAANLVGLCALVLYCCFAQVFLRIPWYVMLIALLAVPLVQIHATGSLVDLPTNLATAVVLLLAYRAFAGREVPSWRDVAVFGLAAAISTNMKFLHLALVSVALLAMLGRLAYWYRAAEAPARRAIVHRVLVLTMAIPLIFATTIKNTVLYGNPVFPLKLSAFGITLPHTMASTSDTAAPVYLWTTPQAIRWGLSIFEVRAFDARRPNVWTGDQGYVPRGVPADRMGGYFFVYVIGSLVLLGLVIARLRSREARMGGVFFALLSIVTSVHGQSHELRYYMYWMITLITLNLYFLVRAQDDRAFPFTPQQFGAVCCLVLATVIWLTRGAYVRPLTQPVAVGYTLAIEPAIRDAVEKSPMICVIGRTNLVFLYAETFHVPLQYSVKAARDESQCGSRVIVPAREGSPDRKLQRMRRDQSNAMPSR